MIGRLSSRHVGVPAWEVRRLTDPLPQCGSLFSSEPPKLSLIVLRNKPTGLG
jgi:hypothetical protein